MELVKPHMTSAAVEKFKLWLEHNRRVTDMDAYVVGTPEELADIAYELQSRYLMLSGYQEMFGVVREKFVLEMESRQRSMEAFTCLH